MKLRITPAMHRELFAVTTATPDKPEPLALVWLRQTSEVSPDVIVVVKVEPFPDSAYVDGPDGANFDVAWLVEAAARIGRCNAGLALAHMHGNKGRPRFSSVDQRTNRSIIRKLALMDQHLPYGAILLSKDAISAQLESSNGSVPLETIVAPEATRFGLEDTCA